MLKYTIIILACAVLTACGGSTEVAHTYPNGKKSEVYTTDGDSLRHGAYTSYHLNGKNYEELEYEHGKLIAVKKVTDSTGKVLAENTLKGGKGTYPHYTPDGRLEAVTHYAGGMPDGPMELYDIEGKTVVSSLFYRQGVLLAAGHPLRQQAMKTAALDTSGNTKLPEGPKVEGFGVELPNKVMRLLVQGKYADLHSLGAEEYQKAYTADQLKGYLLLSLDLMGQMKRYRIQKYDARGSGDGEVVQVLYATEHTHVPGKALITFLREKNKLRLVNLVLVPEEGQQLPDLAGVADKELKLLTDQKPGDLYDRCGSYMKKMLTREQFIQGMSRVYQAGKFTNPQLSQTGFMVQEGTPVVQMVYTFDVAGQKLPIPLLYSRQKGKFVFEGISL